MFESGKSSENPQEDDAIADKDIFSPVGWPGPSPVKRRNVPRIRPEVLPSCETTVKAL